MPLTGSLYENTPSAASNASTELQQQRITRQLQEIDANLSKANAAMSRILTLAKTFKSHVKEVHTSTQVRLYVMG